MVDGSTPTDCKRSWPGGGTQQQRNRKLHKPSPSSAATRGMERHMTIQFLSHEEVCELTGARTKAGQILNLKKNGVRHTIKVNGWPSVTAMAVTAVSAFESEKPVWKSRKAS